MICKSVFCSLIIVYSAALNADIPGADIAIEMGMEDFKQYFSYDFLSSPEGELYLRLSPSFVDSFRVADCRVSAMIAMVNYEEAEKNLALFAAIQISELTPEDVVRQGLSMGFLYKKLTISLDYHVGGCDLPDSTKYKSDNNIRFVIDDVSALEKHADWPKETVPDEK